MATVERIGSTSTRVNRWRGNPSPHQAFGLLHGGYTVLPLVAGVDKFTSALADWDKYLAPVAASALSSVGIRPALFMDLVGVVEIGAGLLVAVSPRIGGLVVAGWLAAIAGNLLANPPYLDIALRDASLAVGAFALARLSPQFGR